jgi:hypothetical protein
VSEQSASNDAAAQPDELRAVVPWSRREGQGANGPSACRMIALPRISNSQGNLTFVEGQNHVPFDVRRVYFLYDVPAGAERGGHSHKELEQLVIPLAGSFDVILDDGHRRDFYRLDRPFSGLYIAPMMWRELKNFTSGAVCLVLASALYDEADYIRNYQDFLRCAREAA